MQLQLYARGDSRQVRAGQSLPKRAEAGHVWGSLNADERRAECNTRGAMYNREAAVAVESGGSMSCSTVVSCTSRLYCTQCRTQSELQQPFNSGGIGQVKCPSCGVLHSVRAPAPISEEVRDRPHTASPAVDAHCAS